MAWRTVRMCDACPFSSEGSGLDLRQSLRGERWNEILRGLRTDHHFYCHKTTEEAGDGSNLVCAGSIEWGDKRGISQNYVRQMERITYFCSKEKP